MPNLPFRSRRELSTGLHLQDNDQNHMAISHRHQTRAQVGAKGAVPPNFGLQKLSFEQKSS